MYSLTCRSLNKHARVRYGSPPQSVITPGEYSSRVTIWKISDEVLLNIFRYYLDDSPRFWPRLVHVCRKWRHIVFAAERALHLRIFCTHGTSVLKAMDCWPTMRIVLEYGGPLALDPPAHDDEDNIMAALKQSDRVSSISLTVPSSLLEKLSAIKRPFLELEHLFLVSRESVQLALPRAFAWGTQLHTLHLTGIAFFTLPQLLYSSRNLVDLQLHEVPNPWLLSPEALTDALSEMAQLRSLSLHFLSTSNHIVVPQPPEKRVFLPSLTRLNFRGITKYLGDLVGGIDAPRLGDIEVTVFNGSIPDISKFSEFVDRIEMHKSHRRVHILSSERDISISLTRPGAPMRLTLQFICGELSGQLFFMAGVCISFFAFLFNVEDLRISTTRPRWNESLYSQQWPELVKSFTGVKWFHVAGNLSTNILRSLQLSDGRRETVLPALHELYIPQPGPRHSSLREAVVSLMISRRISGHHIGVEYERPRDISELRGTGHFSQRVTIEVLSDDILLKIFRHYVDATPQFWSTIAWVCQRWRQIVFTSPLGLNLRLYCTYGTPASKTLDYWPALPITVQYGGVPNLCPPAPEDDDNIVAALKQSGRVSSISLTVTSSLLEKLSAVSEPLSELEELTLLSQDNIQLSLPTTFRWGPRLRTLHSTRVAFSSFPQLLLPSQDLVDLQLHEIPRVGYFPPDAFTNALSGMTQLRILSLHFISFPSRRKFLGLAPPSGERVVLPSLTLLKYRGTSKYLDSLVARIDAPRLGDISITFFSQPTMDASQLGRFIDRTEILRQHSGASIRTSKHAISISFTNPNTPTFLRLQISCKQLDWQLSSMAQILNQFSHYLFRVENMGIYTTKPPSGRDGVGSEHWPELIGGFGGAKYFRVAGGHVTDILCALRPADGEHTIDTTVLPDLRILRIEEPMAMHGPSWDAVWASITSRWLSGRPLRVSAQKYPCHICSFNSTEPQVLKKHLVHTHAHRFVCSHCVDFECTLGHNGLFLEHLASNHPEVARNDALFSEPSFTRSLPYQLDCIVFQHTSLRAPNINVLSTTMVTPPYSQ